MKIAIPTMGNSGWEDRVGEHFGRVPYYAVIDTKTDELSFLDNSSEHMGGRGLPARILSEHGIDEMVCQGLGRRAISLFDENGVKVYIGAYGTVKDAYEAYKGGALKVACEGDGCQQHAFGGHGKGAGHGQGMGRHRH